MKYNFDPTPPREALAYFRAKGIKPGFDHRDVWRYEHATAFTVAKAMQVDILESIRDELDRSLAEGIPFSAFKKDLTPVLQKLGWWGKQLKDDPLTGESKEVQLGTPRRLKTIYEVNTRTARAAGQWQRAQRTKKSHPYLLYQLGPSKEHRAEHLQWNGLILFVDDPFWSTHMPINGYGCKCRVRQISQREYDRLTATGRYLTKAPEIQTREYVNKRTGEVLKVPVGIDPGFDINPGAVARQEHAAQVFGSKLKTASPEVGAMAIKNAAEFIQQGLEANYQRWVTGLYLRDRQAVGELQLVGVLNTRAITRLKQQGVVADTSAITLQDKQVRHLARPNKHARDHALPKGAIQQLSQLLNKPKAILLDSDSQALVYLIDLPEGGYGKVVVNIGFSGKGHIEGKRAKIRTNDIRTASITTLWNIQSDMKGGILTLIDGEI